jgi:lipopolysaccharide biosynthesis protein
MASQYGVHGFCYYYYWFNGRKVLQRPIEEMLKTREPNFPFCVCWANENWTRGWEGLNKEVLLEQRHSREDSVAFMREMVQYFKDDRYIRVGNRPLLLIYRPSLIPELEETVRDWNRVCEENGLERPYLCWVLCFDNKLTNYTKVGFEAAVQLPPHWVQSVDSFFEVKELRDDLAIDPEKSEARLFPYESLARDFAEMQYDQLTFKTVSPSWDNTARRPKGGWIFHGSTPLKYCNWLRNAIASAENNKPEERLVFINAWNEWGEGCHLEPDRRYGHRHLQATWLALNRTRKP